MDIKLRLAQLHVALINANTTAQWPQTVADALKRIKELEEIEAAARTLLTSAQDGPMIRATGKLHQLLDVPLRRL